MPKSLNFIVVLNLSDKFPAICRFFMQMSACDVKHCSEENSMAFDYIPRLAEKEIKRKLRKSGAVLIAGPKYCGKTTTAKTFCRSLRSFSTPTKTALYEPNIRLRVDAIRPQAKRRLGRDRNKIRLACANSKSLLKSSLVETQNRHR
jgi:energy-coupling factor transporter ATP-binding protein EcfA2